MSIFKYLNDDNFLCEVCNSIVQRRYALSHFNGKKHIDNLLKKNPKERITCPCGSYIRNTSSSIANHSKKIKHLKFMNDLKYKKNE